MPSGARRQAPPRSAGETPGQAPGQTPPRQSPPAEAPPRQTERISGRINLGTGKPDEDSLVRARAAATPPEEPPEPSPPKPEAAPASTELSDGSALEELVRQAITPLLREWIDRHLPELVEDIAAREVRKLLAERDGD
jgi:hypothetical protein